MSHRYRQLNFLGFLACAGAMGFALYLEHVGGLEPCPLCIFQRIAMVFTGLVFLFAAVHGPLGWGRGVYTGLALAGAGAGMAIAGRHVWLQNLPDDQVPACGPTLDFLFDTTPFFDAVMFVLRGDGNCAEIDAQWLGLSLPAWTLIGFVALAAWAVLVMRSARPRIEYF